MFQSTRPAAGRDQTVYIKRREKVRFNPAAWGATHDSRTLKARLSFNPRAPWGATDPLFVVPGVLSFNPRAPVGRDASRVGSGRPS